MELDPLLLPAAISLRKSYERQGKAAKEAALVARICEVMKSNTRLGAH